MKNQRKPLSTKKPPIPNNDHILIEEWMNNNVIEEWMNNNVMPKMQELVKEADLLIRKNILDLQFAIKWGYAYYGTEKLGWIIELTPFAASTNIVFLNGLIMDPQPPLGEGETRYVKIHDKNELKDVISFIQQAGNLPGWK